MRSTFAERVFQERRKVFGKVDVAGLFWRVVLGVSENMSLML